MNGKICLILLPLILATLPGCQKKTTAIALDGDHASPATAGDASVVQAIKPEDMWTVDKSRDPVTDVEKVVVLEAYPGSERLIVRRTGKKVDAYVVTGDFLETTENMDSRSSRVTYRLDGGARPVSQMWTISDDNNALFVPGNPIAFLSAAVKAKGFYLRYEPADYTAKTTHIDMTGFPLQAIKNAPASPAP